MRIKRYVLLVWCVLILTGCWDRVEIEDRGFVVGIALDLAQSADIEERVNLEAPGKPKGKHRFVLTQQIVNPQGLNLGSMDMGSQTVPAFMNQSSEGDSISEMVRSFVSRTSKSPYYEHITVIIISEDVARLKEFANVLDFFLRYHEMRRGTKVMVAQGEARKILEVDPESDNIPAMYIDTISQNNYKNTRMIPPTRIGDIHEDLLLKTSYMVQRINLGKDEVKIAGNAVFCGCNNELIGFLGEEETEGHNMVTGEAREGIIEFKIEDNLLVYDINNFKRSIKADVSDPDRIQFDIKLKIRGSIIEALEQIDMENVRLQAEMEAVMEEEVLRLCKKIVHKMQSEFKVDTLGFSAYLNAHHYPLWKKISNDWDQGEQLFSKAKVNFDINVEIQNFGAIIKSERNQGAK